MMHEINQGASSLDGLERFDAALYAKWGKLLHEATTPQELEPRTRAVIQVALDSFLYFSSRTIQRHINEAFDLGSTIRELMEAIMHMVMHEGTAHALEHGYGALLVVIREREKKGLPTPHRGPPMDPKEMIAEAPWPDPPVFPMHKPSPRWHRWVIEHYQPEAWIPYRKFNRAKFEMRKDLTRKTMELCTTAMDTAILWPEPLLDHHMHAAFETGATAQEILEVVVFAADAVQAGRDESLYARQYDGGAIAVHHGVTTLERVLSQRESKGLLAPRNKNSPKVGRRAITRE